MTWQTAFDLGKDAAAFATAIAVISRWVSRRVSRSLNHWINEKLKDVRALEIEVHGIGGKVDDLAESVKGHGALLIEHSDVLERLGWKRGKAH